jgi:hypothetical protein
MKHIYFLLFVTIAFTLIGWSIVADHDNYEYEYDIGDVVFLKYIDGKAIVINRAKYIDGKYKVRYSMPFGTIQTIIVQPCEITKERPEDKKK